MHSCIYFLLLTRCDVISYLSSCCLDFPMVMDYNLELFLP